jgi:hypothetical protein
MTPFRHPAPVDSGSHPDSPPPDSPPAEMRHLLARYPALAGPELDRLARLMMAAPHLEVGLLSSDPLLGDAYHAFRLAERRRLRPTLWQTLLFVAFYLGPSGLIVWAVMEVA